MNETVLDFDVVFVIVAATLSKPHHSRHLRLLASIAAKNVHHLYMRGSQHNQ